MFAGDEWSNYGIFVTHLIPTVSVCLYIKKRDCLTDQLDVRMGKFCVQNAGLVWDQSGVSRTF